MGAFHPLAGKSIAQPMAIICVTVAVFPIQLGRTRASPLMKWTARTPVTIAMSRAMTSTGNQSGNSYCQLLKLSVMMPARSRPLSAMGSRMVPSRLRWL